MSDDEKFFSGDEEVFANSQAEEVEEASASQSADEPSGIDLDAKAEQDAALWASEHSSDEEPFDPERPEDLQTENAKLEALADPSDSDLEDDEEDKEDDDEDDSCVVADDAPLEYECQKHMLCCTLAMEIDVLLCTRCEPRSKKTERQAALAEAICDHYKSGQDEE